MDNQNSSRQFSIETVLQRSRERKTRIVSHCSHSFAEAEDWDLGYWQAQGPEKRLSALPALHENLAKVKGRERINNEYDR